jgi:hypothetical protein
MAHEGGAPAEDPGCAALRRSPWTGIPVGSVYAEEGSKHHAGRWPTDSIWIITALFATTFLHHVYGGFRYKSAKRVKLSFIFVVLFALTVLFYRMGRRHSWAQQTYKGIALVAWVGVVGVLEGGYNHLVKVVLWLAKVPPAKLEKLYPSNEYVLPDDIFFEASGILTFAIGVWLAMRML